MSVDTAISKYPGLREKLGTKPDNALAVEYKISRARVYQFRVAFSVPSLKPKNKGTTVWRMSVRNHVFSDLHKEWVEKTGGTTEQLAEKLGTRNSRITAWTLGAEGRQPSHDALSKLASLLGYEIRLRVDGMAVVRVGDASPVPVGSDGRFYQLRPGERL